MWASALIWLTYDLLTMTKPARPLMNVKDTGKVRKRQVEKLLIVFVLLIIILLILVNKAYSMMTQSR